MDKLDGSDQKLIGFAQKANNNAYAPSSGFFVGAVILLNDGAIVKGANQENRHAHRDYVQKG